MSDDAELKWLFHARKSGVNEETWKKVITSASSTQREKLVKAVEAIIDVWEQPNATPLMWENMDALGKSMFPEQVSLNKARAAFRATLRDVRRELNGGTVQGQEGGTGDQSSG